MTKYRLTIVSTLIEHAMVEADSSGNAKEKYYAGEYLDLDDDDTQDAYIDDVRECNENDVAFCSVCKELCDKAFFSDTKRVCKECEDDSGKDGVCVACRGTNPDGCTYC